MIRDTPRTLDADARKLLFQEAHTHYAWLDRPVADATLHELWDLVKMGPTGANLQPLRLVFVKSAAAKEKLLPTLAPMNVEKARAAPVSVIVARDVAFHRKAPQVMPVMPDLADKFEQMPAEVRERMGLYSSTLQAGYLIIAARALGLDAGPMGGFDPEKVNTAFFPDGSWKASLVINLGYGDEAKAMPRQPRLSFDEACRIE